MIRSSALQLIPTNVAGNMDLAVFLVVGVFAGAHCLGMCGPLVGVYAGRISSQRPTRRGEAVTLFEVRQHALFNSGRAIGYAAVGAAFGLLGGTVFTTVESVAAVGNGVRAATSILVGTVVFLGGLSYVFRGSRASLPGTVPVVSTVFHRVSGGLTGRIDRLAGSVGIIGLGTVHALLPCPIIYPAYLYAFAIRDPFRGVLSLFVLGLGTFPSLFAYGTLLGTLTATQRAHFHRALGDVCVPLFDARWKGAEISDSLFEVSAEIATASNLG